MSIPPNPPLLGTTQIWNDPQAAEEDNEDMTHRTSLYVQIFQSIHDIVMKMEKHLFSSEELACLQKLNEMSYPARYLLIRLCLRKRGKWHSLADLEKRYKIEIGGKERISQAIDELCGITRDAVVNVKDEEPDVIDSTQGENEDSEMPPASRTLDQCDRRKEKESIPKDDADKVYTFGQDDASASLPELLGCITHDELKKIGKQLKVTKTGQNRSSLSDAIMSNASSQTTLTFPVLIPRNKPTKAQGKPRQQLTLHFPNDTGLQKQTTVVWQLLSNSIGRCIRISHTTFELFYRLNIVFFRSTTHSSSSLLLPALLAAFQKRRHADTYYVRTDVFSSRQALLDYEEALILEARVEEALSSVVARPRALSKKAQAREGGKAKEMALSLSTSPRVEAAKVVRGISMGVYDRWKVLVDLKDEDKGSPSLERFDCGHVLTRIVCKGAEALGILKEHDLEVEVHNALLAQKKWRRGQRGAWYDRLALVLMTHSEKTEEILQMAMSVVVQGLCDDFTHLIYRPRLERRLTRLEKMLNVPMNERHKCDGQLKQARDVYVEGVRVKHRASTLVLDRSGRIKGGTNPLSTGRSKSETPFTIFRASTQPLLTEASESRKEGSQAWKGKTLWFTKDGEEASVEQFALEHYHRLGFKGFHSEGRIVSTLFGLLFWDVIFASIPGAFETPFQSAPLDIFEDVFYSARQELIDQRLAALENGEARDLLKQVLNRERPHRTFCIGVDWDFEPDDLLAIVDCLGGHALAIICQVICEDYGQWHGGVPDLLVWNIETRECRFVEVKSPNDKLQENQKVWIDVLIGSDTLVDLCHVIEKGEKGKGREESRRRTRTKDRTSSDAASEDSVESELEDDSNSFQNRVKKHNRDSDDFIPSSARKRKVAR
ncbi:VRR-NUC domain-containing protein [Gautieria morchelliformis]|nr:VRR-NUC domain-containing protein [Gautieria morchelliformis]